MWVYFYSRHVLMTAEQVYSETLLAHLVVLKSYLCYKLITCIIYCLAWLFYSGNILLLGLVGRETKFPVKLPDKTKLMERSNTCQQSCLSCATLLCPCALGWTHPYCETSPNCPSHFQLLHSLAVYRPKIYQCNLVLLKIWNRTN